MDTKGNIKGDCAREPGEGKPKCLPLAKGRSMSKDDRAAAVRRKRREDPVADRAGKGGAPVMVKSESLNTFSNLREGLLVEKNEPTNPELWSRAKSLARQKFDVYPSAYANGFAAKWYKKRGGSWRIKEELLPEELFDLIEDVIEDIAKDNNVDSELIWEDLESIPDEELVEVAAWQRKEGKNPEGGLNAKGIAAYRRENPGSKLQMAVTTKPSKLKPGSKAANRRKSFCARMGGMKKRLTSAKTARDPDSRINKALRKWNC
jgi:hypothetical protein